MREVEQKCQRSTYNFRNSQKMMSPKQVTFMELEALPDDEAANASQNKNSLWPIGKVDPKNARFPCCIVWTPLPVVSWLAPYMGHLGLCLEDGSVCDFAGSNFVSVNNFSYGAVARYIQLDKEKCCFPPNLSGHTCHQSYRHAERGTAISWDDALNSSMHQFQHKYYNLFTCNCYSFVASCLNRLAYDGCMGWNILNLIALTLWVGKWVDCISVLRSLFPFITVMSIGVFMVGWSFIIGMLAFSLLLIGWYFFGIYCAKNLIE